MTDDHRAAHAAWLDHMARDVVPHSDPTLLALITYAADNFEGFEAFLAAGPVPTEPNEYSRFAWHWLAATVGSKEAGK